MARFEQSIVIRRSPVQVFAFLADPRNDPKWSKTSVEMRQTSEGPVGVGTTFRQLGHFMGRDLELHLEVSVYEPDHMFGMKVTSGPFKFAGIRTVEPLPEGTRVTLTGGGSSGGFFKLAEPLMALAANRQLKADLQVLKKVLEAETQITT